ncbi:MAG: 30S ribosomal protein S6 [Candidatus Omnitrophota bacterium]
MKKYELLAIFPPESGPDTRREELQAVEDAVKKVHGTLLERQEMGRRVLGYEVKKSREGFPLLFQLNLDPSKVADLNKILSMEPKVSKFTLSAIHPKSLKKQETSSKPSLKKPAPETVAVSTER